MTSNPIQNVQYVRSALMMAHTLSFAIAGVSTRQVCGVVYCTLGKKLPTPGVLYFSTISCPVSMLNVAVLLCDIK